MAELDILISKAILETLPPSLGDLSAQNSEDEYVGNVLGYSGLYVNRNYRSEDGSLSLECNIISDSPLLASLSGFLNNPLIASMSGRKVIKLDGYKAAMEEITDSDQPTFEIQLPFSSALWTLRFEGFEDANGVMNLANQLPVKEVVQIAE